MNYSENVVALKKQRSLQEVLLQLMQGSQINATQLARNTGLAGTTVRRLCNDPDCNPTIKSIEAIARFFSVTTNQLMGIEPLHEEISELQPRYENWVNIPILSSEEAMKWPHNIEEVTSSTQREYVKIDNDSSEETFAVVLKDQSLEPRFSPGSIMVFSREKAPYDQCYAIIKSEHKELPFYKKLLLDGADVYFKKVNVELPGEIITSMNKDTEQILGILIHVRKDF